MKTISFRGSYTVEAALIIPIVMIIVITTIYYSFYLHDSLVMKTFSYSFVLDLNNYQNKSEAELAELAKKLMDEKTIICKNIEAKVKLYNDGMNISYEGEFSFPFIGMRNILKDSISEINRETKISSVLKSDFVRKSKVAKDALDLE